MAENNLGSVAVGSTVRFKFTTHAASGAAVAPSSAFENADLDIYKDGSSTPRSSANGITMTSPFNSTTGLHHVDIDLSDNTDAGFYATGSTYEVVLTPDETVDSLTVVKVVARFTIGATLDTIKTDTAAILADTGTDGVAIANGAISSAKFAANAIDAAALAADGVDEILDDGVGDGAITVREALRIILASQAGKVSGGGTTSIAIRDVADSKDVITATVDEDGNRTATAVDP